MGIVNLTSDSFYPESRHEETSLAIAAALAQIEAGAEIIDLGAESSRPGASPISPEAEQERMLPVVTGLRDATATPITVDTTRSATAALVLQAGADGINDISAGTADPEMLPLLAEQQGGVVLMHMLGTPRTMQDNPLYDDVIATVCGHLTERYAAAIQAGVTADRIVVDPGIGFGKGLEHNLDLLANLDRIGNGGPVLLGASRKSFLGHLTGAPVQQRLGGSLATLGSAFLAGVSVVRVHDVAESRQFLDTFAAIQARKLLSPAQGEVEPPPDRC
ncbi:MAG: dihydropteroate synthase [bacterium]